MMRGPRSSWPAAVGPSAASRRRICRLVVAGLFVNLVALSAAGSAFAQKKKVIVEQFQGPSAVQFRKMVTGAVAKNKQASQIPDKKVAATEADLGLTQASENYGALAKQLKADLFLKGRIAKGKKKMLTATLFARNAEGAIVGRHAWAAKNPRKLLAAVGRDVGKQVAALIAKAGAAPAVASGGGKAAAEQSEAQAEAEAAADAEKVAAADGDGEGDGEDGDDEDGSSGATKSDDAEGSDDEELAVSKRARRSGAAAGAARMAGPSKWDIAIGLRYFNRNYTYNQVFDNANAFSDSVPPSHKVSLPALALSGEFTPIEYVSILGEAQYTSIAADYGDGARYKTTLMNVSVAARPQMMFGDMLAFGIVGAGLQTVKVDPTGEDDTASRVPEVGYQHLKAGAGVRYGLSEVLSLMAGANYLHMLSLGSGYTDTFENAKARGSEAYAGVSYALPWMDGLEARLLADVRRIVFDLGGSLGEAQATGTAQAGGAVDQYIGVNLQVAYRGL